MRVWVKVGRRASSRNYLQLLLVLPCLRTPSLKFLLCRVLLRLSNRPSTCAPTHPPNCPRPLVGLHSNPSELLWRSRSAPLLQVFVFLQNKASAHTPSLVAHPQLFILVRVLTRAGYEYHYPMRIFFRAKSSSLLPR